VNIEEPEFFHRKVLAKKVSDGKGFDALIELIDQVRITTAIPMQIYDIFNLLNIFWKFVK
jgi:hypothetical protein